MIAKAGNAGIVIHILSLLMVYYIFVLLCIALNIQHFEIQYSEMVYYGLNIQYFAIPAGPFHE